MNQKTNIFTQPQNMPSDQVHCTPSSFHLGKCLNLRSERRRFYLLVCWSETVLSTSISFRQLSLWEESWVPQPTHHQGFTVKTPRRRRELCVWGLERKSFSLLQDTKTMTKGSSNDLLLFTRPTQQVVCVHMCTKHLLCIPDVSRVLHLLLCPSLYFVLYVLG